MAEHLLRAGVLGRHQLGAAGGWCQRFARELRVEELGDAEIEQLGRAVAGDEHVVRLDVPMDDEVLMRVLDGAADLAEQLKPCGRVELPALAEVHDVLAFDVLHREVGKAVGSSAAVEQRGDVRVVEAGEHLPFMTEAADDGLRIHAALEDLDRDAFVEGFVIANAQKHLPHAAVAENAHEPVRADARLGGWKCLGDHRGGAVVVVWKSAHSRSPPRFVRDARRCRRRGVPVRGRASPLWDLSPEGPASSSVGTAVMIPPIIDCRAAIRVAGRVGRVPARIGRFNMAASTVAQA
jgi:hypothetical protein